MSDDLGRPNPLLFWSVAAVLFCTLVVFALWGAISVAGGCGGP